MELLDVTDVKLIQLLVLDISVQSVKILISVPPVKITLLTHTHSLKLKLLNKLHQLFWLLLVIDLISQLEELSELFYLKLFKDFLNQKLFHPKLKLTNILTH